MDAQEWQQYIEERKRVRIQTVAERLRFYRLLRRKTIRDLAEESGCSKDTIWRIENGRGDSRTETLQRLAEALGLEWFDLLGPAPKRPEDVPPAPIAPARVTPKPAAADPSAAAPAADRRPSRAERRRKEREEQKKQKKK